MKVKNRKIAAKEINCSGDRELEVNRGIHDTTQQLPDFLFPILTLKRKAV